MEGTNVGEDARHVEGTDVVERVEVTEDTNDVKPKVGDLGAKVELRVGESTVEEVDASGLIASS